MSTWLYGAGDDWWMNDISNVRIDGEDMPWELTPAPYDLDADTLKAINDWLQNR